MYCVVVNNSIENDVSHCSPTDRIPLIEVHRSTQLDRIHAAQEPEPQQQPFVLHDSDEYSDLSSAISDEENRINQEYDSYLRYNQVQCSS